MRLQRRANQILWARADHHVSVQLNLRHLCHLLELVRANINQCERLICPYNYTLHNSPKPELYKIFSYPVYLSTSGGKQDVYSILIETLLGNIMYNTEGSCGHQTMPRACYFQWKSLWTICWWDRLHINDPWAHYEPLKCF